MMAKALHSYLCVMYSPVIQVGRWDGAFLIKSLIISNLHPSSRWGYRVSPWWLFLLLRTPSLGVNKCMWGWSWTTSLPNDLCRATSRWCGMDCWWENDSRHGPKCAHADISEGEEMRGKRKKVWRMHYLTFTFTEEQLKQSTVIKSTDLQHSYNISQNDAKCQLSFLTWRAHSPGTELLVW